MPPPIKPCIFSVAILTDGIGDLFHFTDFIKAAGQDEGNLQNAYFVIDTNREGAEYDKIISIINSLDKDHPLRKYSDRLILTNPSNRKEKILKLSNMLEDGHPCNFYQVSTVIRSSISSIIDPMNVSPSFFGSLQEQSGGPPPGVGLDFSNLLSSDVTMGLSPRQPGIFIHPSLRTETLDSNNITLTKLGITDNDKLIICYSHVRTDENIIQICRLHKKFGDGAPLAIFLPQGIPSNLSKETIAELQSAGCRLVANYSNNWLSDEDFRQLQIKQAKSSNISVASGDKTTERCIAEGLIPIIEFKSQKKKNFWLGLVETLENLPKDLNQDEKSNNALMQIISYIKAAAEYSANPSIGTNEVLKKIDELSPDCFEYWRKIICPYLRQNHDLNAKVSRNVKIFRMAAELVQNPESEYAKAAAEYFQNMDKNLYYAYISELIGNINLQIGRDSRPEASILIALNKVRRCAEITGVLDKCKTLAANATMSQYHDNAKKILLSANPYQLLGLNDYVGQSYKIIFAELLTQMKPGERTSLVSKYQAMYSNIETSSIKSFIEQGLLQSLPQSFVKEFMPTQQPTLVYSSASSEPKLEAKSFYIAYIAQGENPIVYLEPILDSESRGPNRGYGNPSEYVKVITIFLSEERDALIKQITLEKDALTNAGLLKSVVITDKEVIIEARKPLGLPLARNFLYPLQPFDVSTLTAEQKREIIIVAIAKFESLYKNWHRGDITPANVVINKDNDGKFTVDFVNLSNSAVIIENAEHDYYKSLMHALSSGLKLPEDTIDLDNQKMGPNTLQGLLHAFYLHHTAVTDPWLTTTNTTPLNKEKLEEIFNTLLNNNGNLNVFSDSATLKAAVIMFAYVLPDEKNPISPKNGTCKFYYLSQEQRKKAAILDVLGAGFKTTEEINIAVGYVKAKLY